ncbi:unnamed protein product [Cercospora beticola]|nr:unnamed protein product [Cercospora beticola]
MTKLSLGDISKEQECRHIFLRNSNEDSAVQLEPGWNRTVEVFRTRLSPVQATTDDLVLSGKIASALLLGWGKEHSLGAKICQRHARTLLLFARGWFAVRRF